ncbi:Holliday junction resolvase RuvX [Paenibacillus thermotolerans]|uniref:Holliday junction resolvase RuvX n=1 Tax=Paenibacillus thermotolerans TaxID=3027807 RepID=UPI002367BE9E|nr:MULTISPECIES: Holliday junction resolvase RuvX [unclassified Paenibacillus]
MRYMGLDYGDRQIGVAVSDELGFTAQGLTVLRNSGDERVLQDIAGLVREWNVTDIVVGLPKNMNGSVGPRGELAMRFAEELRNVVSCPVHLWDERLTTKSAERTLIEADVSRKKRKGIVDRIAAALILQNYMDAKSMKR